jgi:preprotein translocase subunit SecG
LKKYLWRVNMTGFPVLAVSLIMKTVAGLFFICSVALILIILIQKGRGGGLSAAFGGGMAGGILGTKTGDFLTWVTIVLVALFLTFAVVLAKFYKPTVTDYGGGPAVQQEQPQPTEQPGAPAPGSEPNVVGEAKLPGLR